MAFNFDTLSPTRVEAVGSMTKLMFGRVALVSGSATVTLPTNLRVRASWSISNSSTNPAYTSAEAANVITITGNGTDTVTWIAVVDGGI